MTKKKLLVVDYKFCLGGVGIAAANLINNLSEDYDIDLLLMEKGGVLENRLPQNVDIKYVSNKLSKYYYLTVAEFFKQEKNIFKRIKRLWLGLLGRLGLSKNITKKYVKKEFENFPVYDCIINNDMDSNAVGLGGLCHISTMYGLNATKKFLIIHGDFVANNYDKKYFIKEYSKYDKIISVSESLNNQMCELFPQYKDKLVGILNFQDDKNIIRMAEEQLPVAMDKSLINLVSASRLTELKGYMRTLNVIKRLVSEGFNNFCWHILGDGEQRVEIENFIKENRLENYVLLYGTQSNPFPYFKEADLLMLNSYHEAAPMVYGEALMLGTPIFSTRTISANELVGDYGWVVDNNEDAIYVGMKYLLKNPGLITDKKELLKNYCYDNDSIKKKYKEII